MTKSVRRDGSKKAEPPQGAPVERPGSDKQDGWDGVDESVLESFPASDAPTGWAGRDIAPQDLEQSAKP